MTEHFHSLKCFSFYTITSSFEEKANLSDIDNDYPVKFHYFDNLFRELQRTHFNGLCNDQELGLKNYE